MEINIIKPQSDLKRQSSTSDTWGRYYTSSSVSNTLVNAVHSIRPKVIVELGSGYGSIMSAAAQKWGAAQLITVDTDYSVALEMSGHRHERPHAHYIHDALDDNISERIGIPLESVDIGLCNPPYVRPRWRPSFGQILEDAGLSGTLKSVHDAGADLLFIAQNLRLLKKYGKLGLIVPDGLITGEKYQGVRSQLLREHLVEQVIQLPRRVFSKTEAQAHLLVLSKHGGTTQSVVLRAMYANGVLSTPIHIAPDEAKHRLDYSFHFLRVRNKKNCYQKVGLSVRDVTEVLIRGSLSSNQLDNLHLPVFHLGNFPSVDLKKTPPQVPKRFIHSKQALSMLPTNIRIAERGDILIARIGRNLQEKVCEVRKGGCIISDCIFALRIVPTYRDMVLTYLTSSTGRQVIEATAHGVGAKYLSRSDLLDLILPI